MKLNAKSALDTKQTQKFILANYSRLLKPRWPAGYKRRKGLARAGSSAPAPLTNDVLESVDKGADHTAI